MLEVITTGTLVVRPADKISILESNRRIDVLTYAGVKGEITVGQKFSDLTVKFNIKTISVLNSTPNTEGKHDITRVTSATEGVTEKANTLCEVIKDKYGSIYHMRAISSHISGQDIAYCNDFPAYKVREAEFVIDSFIEDHGIKGIHVDDLPTMDVMSVYGIIIEAHSIYSYLPRDYHSVECKRDGATVDSSCILGLGAWYEAYLSNSLGIPSAQDDLHKAVEMSLPEAVDLNDVESDSTEAMAADHTDWRETPISKIRISGNVVPRQYNADFYPVEARSEALFAWHIVRSTFDKVRAALNNAVAPLSTAFDALAEVPDAKNLVCEIIETHDLDLDLHRLCNFVGRQIAFDDASRFSASNRSGRNLSDEVILVPMRISFVAAVAAQNSKVALHTKGLGGLIVSFYAALNHYIESANKYDAASTGGSLALEKDAAADWLFSSIQTYLKANGVALEKNASLYSLPELFHKIAEIEPDDDDSGFGDMFDDIKDQEKHLNLLRAAVSHIVEEPLSRVMAMTTRELHDSIIAHVDDER